MSANVERTGPAPIYTADFWRGYWITMRPYLFFVSGAAGLLGLSQAQNLSWGKVTLAGVAFFLAYGLGQALTDVTQIDTDAISSPYRPLTQGKIGKGSVVAVSLAGLSACCVVFVWLNPWNILFAILGVVGLATYTWFKRRWWGGPPWNSWIVADLVLMGALASGVSPANAFSNPVVIPIMVSAFFSYAIFVLLGYFKDVEADRATGYNTFVVAFGRRSATVLSAVFLICAVVASLLALRHADFDFSKPAMIIAILFWIAAVVIGIWAHLAIARTTTDDEAGPAIANTVRSFVLLQLGTAGLLWSDLAWVAVGFYAAFELVLAARPQREQV